MAYIKKKSERKFKITVCNGYKVNGQKRMKAQTITVPSSVPKRGIQQYVMAEAERIEKKFKYRQCGLSKDYHLHTLRHFYATYLLQEGTSKQVAASLLGHADTAFLERTYCHPQDAVKLQAANLMQDLLNSQNPCYVAFMKNKNRKVKKAG